jgi:hypothetical protein
VPTGEILVESVIDLQRYPPRAPNWWFSQPTAEALSQAQCTTPCAGLGRSDTSVLVRPQLVVPATRDMFLAWCWFRLRSAPVPSAEIQPGTNADPMVGARTWLRTERQLTPLARSSGRLSGSWTGTSAGAWWWNHRP